MGTVSVGAAHGALEQVLKDFGFQTCEVACHTVLQVNATLNFELLKQLFTFHVIHVPGEVDVASNRIWDWFNQIGQGSPGWLISSEDPWLLPPPQSVQSVASPGAVRTVE